MPKLEPGSQSPQLTFETIDKNTVSLRSDSHRFTHIQFRRFAGCPICDMHLRQFSAQADRLQTAGIQEIVFFHSTRDALLKYNSELPFHVIADPTKKIYRAFGVEASLLSVLHPQAMLQGLRGVFKKGLGLSLKNGPLGLPADFLLDPSGTVLAAHYGKHAYDQWSVDDILQIATEQTPAAFASSAS